MSENSDVMPILDAREHVRRRPGMYFGGVDSKALHQLVFELVENSIGQAVKGLCNRIQVILQDNGCITVADNGLGIPIETFKDTGKPFLELVLTEFAIVNSLGRDVRTFNRVGFGVGLWAVNAVCAELVAQVRRDGFLCEQRYRQGKPQENLTKVRPLDEGEETGTTITFTPDFTVFDRNEFSYEILYRHLREVAFLVHGVKITLEDRRTNPEGKTVEFHFPGGLADYVTFLNRDYHPLHSPIVIRETVALEKDNEPTGETADIEIAIQYSDAPQPIVLSYVNTFNISGGTHVKGFIWGLDRAASNYWGKAKLFESFGWYDINEYDLVTGLTVVINLFYSHPMFAGSRGYELSNPEFKYAVWHILTNAFERFAEQYPDEMRRIAEHFLANKNAREARRYGDASTIGSDTP